MKKILILLLFLPSLLHASNYGQSSETKSAIITYTHSVNCDSGFAIFSYPDTSNFYDTVMVLPNHNITPNDSSMLWGVVNLDSMGTHFVKMIYYERGAGSISGYSTGIWFHFNLAGLDGWTPITDNDSLIVDMSSLSARPAIGDTSGNPIWSGAEKDSILDIAGHRQYVISHDTLSTGDSIAVLADSASYQGIGADSASIINGVAEKFGLVAGNLDSIIVLDSTTSAAIPNCAIGIENTSGTFLVSGITNTDGVFTFGNLNGTVHITPSLFSYTFFPSQDTVTFTASAGEIDTILAISWNIAPYYVRIAGNIEEFGSPVKYADIIYSVGGRGGVYYTIDSSWQVKSEQITQSDVSGDFYFDVIASPYLMDEKGRQPKYNVLIKEPDGTIILPSKKFTAPTATPTRIARLVGLL